MKTRFTIKFPSETANKPLTYILIKEYNWKINILRAAITGDQEGMLLMEVEADDSELEKGLEFLRNEKITIIPLNQQLKVDREQCIHCGACTAVCYSGALQIDRSTWEVTMDSEKCVMCGLCVSACPLRIISVVFK